MVNSFGGSGVGVGGMGVAVGGAGLINWQALKAMINNKKIIEIFFIVL